MKTERVAVYDYDTIVHCMRPPTNLHGVGCIDGTNRGCTCNCDRCNGRKWVTPEEAAKLAPPPQPPRSPPQGWRPTCEHGAAVGHCKVLGCSHEVIAFLSGRSR